MKKFPTLEAAALLVSAAILAAAVRSHQDGNSGLMPEMKSFPVSRSSVERLCIKESAGSPCHGAIFEAFDYLCPPCHARFSSVEADMVKYPQFEWGLLPFPLSMHKESYQCALAGYEALRTGTFRSFLTCTMATQVILFSGPTYYFQTAPKDVKFDWLSRNEARRIYAHTLNAIKKLPITYTPCFIAFNPEGSAIGTDSIGKALDFAGG